MAYPVLPFLFFFLQGNPTKIANQPAPYRGPSGPSGPKCRKSLENVSRGASGPGTPTSLQKVSGTVWELGIANGGVPGRGFQIVEHAAFSSRGNLLLQGNSYLKSTRRLLLRRRV